MGFGKFLLGGLCAVGAVVAAPVVLPVAAAAGTAAVGAAGAAVTGVAAAAGTAGAAVTGAAAAAGTAVAGTAVGGAAIGAMGAVGGAVGTAAGAVGISSVATVAGTSAGAAAVGAIATSTAVGVAGTVSGAGKMMEASQTKEMAERQYKDAREKYDMMENKVTKELEDLGELKLEIWSGFNRFTDALKKIGKPEELKELGLDEMLHFEKDELDNINAFGLQAKDILQGGAASMAGGRLIGIATSAGITSAASSMGIAGLHGAAAANASLAALGGGSLASGGLGMAGGAAVSQGLVFAPALAISGMFLHSKGKANLEVAKKTKEEVDNLTIQLDEAKEELCKLQNLSIDMRYALSGYRKVYNFWVDWLEKFTEKKENCELLRELSHLPKNSEERKEFEQSEDGKKFLASGMITSILKDLASTKFLEEANGDKGYKKVEEEKVNEKIERCSERWEEMKLKLNE